MSIAVTSKKHNPRSKYRVTKHEKIELEIFNADLRRSYPNIDDTPPLRSALVHRATETNCSRFRLCLDVMTLARAIHNPMTRRVAVTVNDALQMLANMPAHRPDIKSANLHGSQAQAAA